MSVARCVRDDGSERDSRYRSIPHCEGVPRISVWGAFPDPGASNKCAESEEEVNGCAAARPACCGSDALLQSHARLRALTRSSDTRALLRRENRAAPSEARRAPTTSAGSARGGGAPGAGRPRPLGRARSCARRGAASARVPGAGRRDMLDASIRVKDCVKVQWADHANGSNRLSRAGGPRLPARGVCGDTGCATYA